MKYLTQPLTILLVLFANLIFAQENSRELQRMNPKESIATNTANSQNHTTLLAVIEAAELEEILNEEGPFTVFAPSDIAFEKLTSGKIDELLLPQNKKNLKTLITYHIVAGNFSASKILKEMCRGAGRASFTTVQGDELIATMSGIDIVLTDSNGNTARITTADSEQSNGVIHEIDSVFLPAKL
ncbi:fasciclin domain-containing protein [Aggregatimonas sangjinii]|uniref:Fasciclin domain-containing protein n=1 Tax=Aggregatimonas sangjinii TaxID=2583587 RepID=A0A5B7SNI9_9FLAO|nr:fasciclin domain-containing protein [Aggregatimonas sangjinii]QCX00215.1 fasciclin domain-containing protein [Aggregatimonas sangjinii]